MGLEDVNYPRRNPAGACQALASALNTAPERLVWAHGASDVILRTASAAAKRAGVVERRVLYIGECYFLGLLSLQDKCLGGKESFRFLVLSWKLSGWLQFESSRGLVSF